MKASIDIGSNSILLLAGEFENGRFFESVNMARVTGLGRGIDKTGELSREGMDASFEVLKEYKGKLDSLGITSNETMVTATEASRVAQNFSEFSTKIKKELGFKINLINAEGEAFFCAKGVNLGDETLFEDSVIIDLGGASTELILFATKPYTFKKYISLPIGSVRATDWIEAGTFDENIKSVFDNFDIHNFISDEVIGVAGTVTSLAAMMLELDEYSDKEVMGKIFGAHFLQEFVKNLEKMTPDEILKKYPVAGKRSSTIVGGSKVILELCQRLKVEKLFISTYGLRFGTIIEDEIEKRFLQEEN
jgi:exopolyphosphatase/guanosine-5'-triphosphate,3'-diphosphate pyrophosphatase